MKKENMLVIALICVAFAGVMIHNRITDGEAVETPGKTSKPNPKDAGIQWQSYDEGLKLAKSRNKHVFLYFHADWCTYCKKMEATTFMDKKIWADLNENFISIQVDTEKIPRLQINGRSGVCPPSGFSTPTAPGSTAFPGT
nr:DUF255 domain-containing protein [Desulfobacula sp.]